MRGAVKGRRATTSWVESQVESRFVGLWDEVSGGERAEVGGAGGAGRGGTGKRHAGEVEMVTAGDQGMVVSW